MDGILKHGLRFLFFFLIFSLPAFYYLPSDRKNSVSVFDAAVKGGRYALVYHDMK